MCNFICEELAIHIPSKVWSCKVLLIPTTNILLRIKTVITCTPQNEGYPHSIHVQSLQHQIVCLLWEHTCTHVFRELFQPLVCYILYVPTIYSDGATYSTLALLSSILWVRSPCFPDWGLKSKSSGTARRVATWITQGHTHILTVHQKRIWWHQSKSLGLWKCWTVTCRTNGLC